MTAIATLICSSAHAQLQLDRCFPPVVAIGSSSSVKAEGKFPTWPVKVACDRDDITLTPGEESGDFTITVNAKSHPGVAWIRVHDQVSASKLVPLIIEPIAPVTETEPNNRIAEATELALPSIAVGRLGKRRDVDTYRVEVKADQTLVVSCMANRVLASPMDCVLQLVDERNNVLVQTDDTRGLDPQIVYQAERDATILVRMFAFPETPNSTIGYAGETSFVYSLRVTTGPFVDHVLPLVITGETPGHPTPIGWNLSPKSAVPFRRSSDQYPIVSFVDDSLGWQWHRTTPESFATANDWDQEPGSVPKCELPCVFSGNIGRPAEVDRLRFEVRKSKTYHIAVHSRDFGLTLDSVLRVVDPKDGRELSRNDDASRNEYDAAIDFKPKVDGEVELQVSDLVDGYGPGHSYSVVVQAVEPSYELSLAADHFNVKAGESIEIPITVARHQGFAHKVKVTAQGLPEGVTSTAVMSEPKGASAKAVKLKISAEQDAAFQGKIRVSGIALDAEDQPFGSEQAAQFALRKLVPIDHVWLSVSPKE